MGKILIVDDENSIRVTLCEFLNRRGDSAESASNALEAFYKIGNSNYDVVVSDIVMPQLSGMQLLEQIRQHSQTTQVIIMTGEPTVDTAVLSVQKGANDYLIKPIRKETFLRSVDNALKIKELSDAKRLLEQKNLLYQHQLEEMVTSRTAELEKNMQGIVFLLSSVVEVRDPFTAGHQSRVGNMSAAIGEIMGFDRKRTELLRIIGYLHDIGKIRIPTEILSKPSLLHPIERKIIETHPQSGFDMLDRVNLPPFIGEVILQHHERYDGSGYPKGLKASQQFLEAQIIAVADVVEAMTAHRPYRSAMDLCDVLNELQLFSGQLYAPEVVSACLYLFEKKGYLLDKMQHAISFPF